MFFEENDAFQIFVLTKVNEWVDGYLKPRCMNNHDNRINIAKCYLMTCITKLICDECESRADQLSEINDLQQELNESFDRVRDELMKGTFDDLMIKRKRRK